MAWRDRIIDFRRVKASHLRPHPSNWRRHPSCQRRAWDAVLDDLGFADAVLARACDDGSLELIDGHMRVERAGEREVPVLVLDLTAEEAARAVLTHDSLTLLANVDDERLDALISAVEPANDALARAIESMAHAAERLIAAPAAEPRRDLTAPELFQVVVECADERVQQQVYQRLKTEGYRCRVLTL